MLRMIDKIWQADPDALIIVMGDHGSYRYSDAWKKGSYDPNTTFHAEGLDSDLVTLDYFGIMMAVGSHGKCDDLIYPTLTPVNLMRIIFACLSGDRTLLDKRAADISLYPYGPYMTVQDGKILKPWLKIEPE